ncbi:MAG: sigma-70 family RNA polymerase sigma factor [Aureliella sp.]
MKEDSKLDRDDSEDPDRYARFVKLLVANEPNTRAFLRGLLPTWNDVDEVVQEASLVAWRKFDSFVEGTSFGGWFLTIARYEALRYRRNLARSPLVFTDEVWALLEVEAEANELDRESHLSYLEGCLQKLGNSQRELILKAHAPGVVIRELADQAGRSEQALYKALQRWRRALLECVSQASALEVE